MNIDNAMPNFSGVPALLDQKPSGMLWMLSEEMRIPKGTSTTWFHKIKKRYATSSILCFDKRDDSGFFINHFAGCVKYDHRDFMNKNRDSMEPTLIELMKSASVTFLSNLFKEKQAKRSSAQDTSYNKKNQEQSKISKHSSKRRTMMKKNNTIRKEKRAIALQFRTQLRDLMSRIESAHVQFVRCIKPNTINQNLFDGRHVLQQLKYSGIGELLEFRKLGYPYRYNYLDFRNKYQYILTRHGTLIDKAQTLQQQCQAIIKYLTKEQQQQQPQATLDSSSTSTITSASYRIQYGKTKVFLDRLIHSKLKHRHSTIRIESAVMMQQMIRGMLARRRHRSRLQVLQEYPILLANHDRLALAQFVSSYAHYIVTGDNNNSDDDNVDTKKNSTLSSSSFKEIIRSAQRLHDHLLRVEHGASVVRTLLTRM